MRGVDCDVLVVGGGPVGMATALYAVQAGLRTTVIEPRIGPVDKACGEGVMPGALRALHGLGVDQAGSSLTGIIYRAGPHSARADFRGALGRGIRRTELYASLQDRAERAGVQWVSTSMRALSQDEHGVQVRVGGAAAPLRARYAVGADGLHSRTRREAGLDDPRRPRRRFGYRQHFSIAPWTTDVEVHWGPDAEVYCTPVGSDTVGVAVLSSTRTSFFEHLAAFPELAERLGPASAASELRAAGPLRQRVRSRARGRVVLVGDAGGYVDALTGEGLAVGLAQAAVAADALAQGRPQDYPRLARRVSWRSTALTSALLSASHVPVLRSALVPAAVRWPGLFQLAVNELAATAAAPASA
jgi:flavin-dependent dehydrogenase